MCPKYRPIKGVLHLLPHKAPKLAYFVLYLKNINIFLKNNASYSKLSKIKVGHAAIELLLQTQHLDCLDL